MIEWIASLTAIVSIWLYGNGWKDSGYFGLVSQFFWWWFSFLYDFIVFQYIVIGMYYLLIYFLYDFIICCYIFIGF